MSASGARPAAREPMLWLVVALPVFAVVAGIATLVLALRSGGADAVPSQVRRTAQIQVADLSADQLALRAKLRATLQVDVGTGALELRLLGAAASPPPTLRLDLVHPLHAEADRSLILVASGSTWHGRIDPARTHAWNLRLVSIDASWRLIGRLEREAAQATLRPALSE